jgi:hypothetical protein
VPELTPTERDRISRAYSDTYDPRDVYLLGMSDALAHPRRARELTGQKEAGASIVYGRGERTADDVMPYTVMVCWGGTQKRVCTTETQYRAAVAEVDAYIEQHRDCWGGL